jgi:hypothetical protein
LRSLRLDDNGLRELPDAIARLTALRTLSLRDNALCLLPAALGRLTALEELDVRGNPLQSPPPDVVRRGAQAVVGHLGDLQRLMTPPPPSPLELELEHAGAASATGATGAFDSCFDVDGTELRTQQPLRSPAARADIWGDDGRAGGGGAVGGAAAAATAVGRASTSGSVGGVSMGSGSGASGEGRGGTGERDVERVRRPYTGVGTASRPSTSRIGTGRVVRAHRTCVLLPMFGSYKTGSGSYRTGSGSDVYLSGRPSYRRW